MKKLGFAGVVALAFAAVACGEPAAEESSTLKVSGSIDTQRQALDNASAVAISSDGRTFSAYLQSNGKFSLKLPVGHTYRVIIANSTSSGQLRPIGHLVNPTTNGKADVIAVRKGGSMNLGTLRPAGTSSNTLKTACDCPGDKGSAPPPADKGGDGSYPDKGGDGSYPDKGGDTGSYPDEGGSDEDAPNTKGGSSGKGEGGDDYECRQKDSDKDRVCTSASDVELEADNAPGDKCATDDDDDVAPKPSSNPCSTPDENKDGKDDDSTPPSTKGGDDEDAPSTKGGDPGSDKGAGGSCSSCSPTPPSSCTYSKECGVGSSCVASRCTPDSSSGGTPSK